MKTCNLKKLTVDYLYKIRMKVNFASETGLPTGKSYCGLTD